MIRRLMLTLLAAILCLLPTKDGASVTGLTRANEASHKYDALARTGSSGDELTAVDGAFVFVENQAVDGDGDWCFLCGEGHPDDGSAFRVVGIGHLIAGDTSLGEVLGLDVDEEAERVAVGGLWTHRRF